MEGRRRCGVFLHFRITISETLTVGVVVQPKRKLFRAQRGNCARPGRGGAQRPKSETTESGERMQLKASTDYGIRTILYLAAEKDVRSSKEIAREMSIPRDYLIQLAQLLRNAGLIEAKPGKHGGYALARDASDITLLEVIAAMEDAIKVEECSGDQNTCDRDPADCNQFYPEEDSSGKSENSEKACKVRRSYALIQESFNAYLNSLTVDLLLDCAREAHCSVEYLSKKLSEESKRLSAMVA